MYGYIYLTENLINGKKYIGQHRCIEFDTKYYGSGVLLSKAIQKYGKEHFKVTVLCECFSEEELNEKERLFIAEHNAVESCNYYNIADGGSNANSFAGKSTDEMNEIVSRWRASMNNRSEEEKQKTYEQWLHSLNSVSEEELALRKQRQSEGSRRARANRTPEQEKERVDKILETRRNKSDEEKQATSQKHTDANNKMWEEMTPEKLAARTQKYKETRSKQTDDRKREISERARENTIKQLANRTEEELYQRSKKFSETWKNKSEEERAEYSKRCSERSTGRIWVTNGEKESPIKPEELDLYLSQGYIKGRKKTYASKNINK